MSPEEALFKLYGRAGSDEELTEYYEIVKASLSKEIPDGWFSDAESIIRKINCDVTMNGYTEYLENVLLIFARRILELGKD